jgi:hypothetical protein
MVIDVQGSEPGRSSTTASDASGPLGDESARRLALVIGAGRLDAAGDGPDAEIDALAWQLRPILAWARAVPQLTDAEAVRRGITVARTRSLVGMPQQPTLVAMKEVAAVLGSDGPATHRLGSLASEVSVRVRRTSVTRDHDDRRAD